MGAVPDEMGSHSEHDARTNAIHGWAHRARAKLELDGDTLRWRAQLGAQVENVVTTIHDVRYARFVVMRVSRAGLGVAALGALWMIRESVLVGVALVAVAIGLFVWRAAKPRAFLLLEMHNRQLLMRVDREAFATARALVERIDRAIASGELPDSPPALP